MTKTRTRQGNRKVPVKRAVPIPGILVGQYQEPATMSSDTEIVRRQDGSIDIDHYARRASSLRTAARHRFRASVGALADRAVKWTIATGSRDIGRSRPRAAPARP